ncbi:Hypothetical protein, putative [Bodo saltans]|uniref:Uncharacterized protein n=1 Tax=Bodo saltans TaxID=75058 RepID=A0A0S4JK58_BODSA|nr:Hypothetical protein, putative [Bodo saltans]|eukprot:CUG90753.1 Hypothetical protein, putative [Bodo saltans]
MADPTSVASETQHSDGVAQASNSSNSRALRRKDRVVYIYDDKASDINFSSSSFLGKLECAPLRMRNLLEFSLMLSLSMSERISCALVLSFASREHMWWIDFQL